MPGAVRGLRRYSARPLRRQGLKLRLSFPDQLPGRAIQGSGQLEHRLQARVTQSTLDETYIGRVARSLRRQGLLRHPGFQPPSANDATEMLRCDMRFHMATVGDGDYCQNRQ